MKNVSFKFLVFRDVYENYETWRAVCLNHYFAIQVRSEEKIPILLESVLCGWAHLLKVNNGSFSFKKLKPAPKSYINMYQKIEKSRDLILGCDEYLFSNCLKIYDKTYTGE